MQSRERYLYGLVCKYYALGYTDGNWYEIEKEHDDICEKLRLVGVHVKIFGYP